MKRRLFFLTLILCMALSLSAQDATESQTEVEVFQERFENATLEIKIEILQNAANTGKAEFAPLYQQAIEFVVNNAELLRLDSEVRELSLLAVQELGNTGYSEGSKSLWRLFEADTEATTRIAVLTVLAKLVTEESPTLERMNVWLDTQNSLKQAGSAPDVQVIERAIITLGEIKSATSFPMLIESLILKYSDAITDAAKAALFSIEGDTKDLVIDAIQDKPVSQKIEVFNLFMDTDYLNDQQKSEVAQASLNNAIGLRSSSVSDMTMIRELRYIAAEFLVDNTVSDITRAAVRHLNLTVVEYDRGITTKNRVLEAVALLGSTGTEAAAVRLSDFLELLNSYTEKSVPYDTQIVLSVIQNLKRLGKGDAYNALLYTTFLNYPDRVKDAARDAMNSLAR